jgi:hypothetical protein
MFRAALMCITSTNQFMLGTSLAGLFCSVLIKLYDSNAHRSHLIVLILSRLYGLLGCD